MCGLRWCLGAWRTQSNIDRLGAALFSWRMSTRLQAFLTTLLFLGMANLLGQGTVVFTNSGDGVDAPITVNGGPIQPGQNFGVILLFEPPNALGFALSDGSGVFDGGEIAIPEHAPGSTVELMIVILNRGTQVYESAPLEVVLGGVEDPAYLEGLEPIDIEIEVPQSHEWAVLGEDFGEIGPIQCVSTGVLGFAPSDPRFCSGIPIPDRFRTLYLTRTGNGELELYWPQNLGLILYGSSDLMSPDWKPIEAAGVRDGAHFVRIAPSEKMGIFRLAERSQTQGNSEE